MRELLWTAQDIPEFCPQKELRNVLLRFFSEQIPHKATTGVHQAM
jgi:hypothetical protein